MSVIADDGKLLHDVLLYDAAGAPLDIGAAFQDPNRRVVKASTNASIFNNPGAARPGAHRFEGYRSARPRVTMDRRQSTERRLYRCSNPPLRPCSSCSCSSFSGSSGARCGPER
jgi:hypothetical protein